MINRNGSTLDLSTFAEDPGLPVGIHCLNFSDLTPTLQKPEGFRVKASEGEVVVLYFEPSATQDLKSSGFPEG